ncbi:MAG: hypothetical protein AMXMBFR64_24860 [Myxococcales bacterium]
MDRPIRPIDLEYAKDPEKRREDHAAMLDDLRGISASFAAGTRAVSEGRLADAARWFIDVAERATGGLHLYEALGLNFENPRLGYPHYLLYQLESHLEGQRRVENDDGSISVQPEHPELGEILHLVGHGPDDPALASLDTALLQRSATRIVEFVTDRILSEPLLLERE